MLYYFLHGVTAPSEPGSPHCRCFTITGTSIGQHRTLTRDSHPYPRRNSNPQSQQASERAQNHALNRAATRFGIKML